MRSQEEACLVKTHYMSCLRVDVRLGTVVQIDSRSENFGLNI